MSRHYHVMVTDRGMEVQILRWETFDAALECAKLVRQGSPPTFSIHITNDDRYDCNLVDGQYEVNDGLTPEERDAVSEAL